MWNIWRWSEGTMEKNSITIVKWTNRVENGVKRRVDENFHWRMQNLWYSASKRCRSTATAPISVSGGPDAREYHSVPHFFFLSPLYFFPLFFFPLPLPPLSLSIRSSFYRSNDSRYSLLSNSIALERIYFTGWFGRAVIVQF